MARQGDRADLPAADPDERAGDRRLRPARRGRVPQLLHRLDRQALPQARAEGDERDLGAGLLSLSKSVVVVDEWSTCTTTTRSSSASAQRRSARDVLLTEGPVDHLDHAPTQQFYGGKLGIDATRKGPTEGTREWPPEIEMSRGGPRPRHAPLGRVRHRARSRCTERANASEFGGASVWCVVDRGTESRPTASPGSEPLADRLRDRHRLRPRRPRHQLDRRRRRRGDRASSARPLGPRLDRAATRRAGRGEPETRPARHAGGAPPRRVGDARDGGRRRSSATRARSSSRARRSASARVIGGSSPCPALGLHGRAGVRQPAPEEASTSGRSTTSPRASS